MTAPEQKLKPCPFCGDADEFNPSVSISYGYKYPGTGRTDLVENGRYVECDKCGCVGPIKAIEAFAITAWNTRPAPAELVEALRHALTFIENRFSDLSPEKRSTVEHIRAALHNAGAAS